AGSLYFGSGKAKKHTGLPRRKRERTVGSLIILSLTWTLPLKLTGYLPVYASGGAFAKVFPIRSG
ncbi:MAG: hypothetical protein IJH78_06585, partial [Clostridia bacterium]|nr:hypothetical protein [Clostridia bacterium]